MKILTTLLLTCLLLLASCSKSLTDLGYAGGGLQSYDPVSRHSVHGDVHPFSTTNIIEKKPNVVFLYGEDGALEKISMKQRIKVLNKFYKQLLSPKINLQKFSDKYLKMCIDDIAAYVEQGVEKKSEMGGWEVFLPKDRPKPHSFRIEYDKQAWYNIYFDNEDKPRVAVQTVMFYVTNPPAFVGIKYFANN